MSNTTGPTHSLNESQSFAVTPEGEMVTKRSSMKLSVLAGAVGTTIEYYDFSIYVFLAPLLAARFFPKENATAALLYIFAVFALAFVVRPLGGILVGHIGDRHGRRFVLMMSVTLMAGATTLMGVLPPFAAIGVAAPLLLVLLRCLQGVSAGGEVGSAATYIAEISPDHKRGVLTSTTQVGTLFGTMLGSFTVGMVTTALGHDQMAEWGWRIPFLLSLPLGVIAVAVRHRLEESKQFMSVERAGKIARVPFFAAISLYPIQILKIFCLSLVSFASYYLVFTYLPTYFQRQGIMSASAASWSATFAVLVGAVSIPFWGKLSDWIGRKPLLVGVCLGNVILPYPAFVVMHWSLAAAAGAQLVLGQLEACYLAVLLTAYCEMFPVKVRLSGLTFGHNLSALASGATAPFLATWLIATTGQEIAPSWILIGTGLVSLLVAMGLAETAGRPLPTFE